MIIYLFEGLKNQIQIISKLFKYQWKLMIVEFLDHLYLCKNILLIKKGEIYKFLGCCNFLLLR